MATVYKRGNIWWARWYQPSGKRVSKSTGTDKKREADRLAAEMEAKDRRSLITKEELATKYQTILRRASEDAQIGRLSTARAEELLLMIRQTADPAFRVQSLSQHLKEWHESTTSRVDAGTSASYGDMVRRMSAALGPVVLAAPVSALTKQQVEKALHAIKKAGARGKSLKGSTVNMDLRALRQALEAAVEENLVARNVARGVKPLSQKDSAEVAPFTAAEVQVMIDHPKTSEEWRGAILFGAHTGLRLGDIVKLGSSYIDGSVLVIRPKKTERKKKTLYVPLSPDCLAWIKDKVGKYFPTLSKIAVSNLSNQFSAIMKRAEIPSEVTLPGEIKAKRSYHSLRHSFVSWLAEADVQEDVRRKLSGHSKGGVHAIYTHRDESLVRAVQTLPRVAA